MTVASELRTKAELERPEGGWCVLTEPYRDQMLVAVATQAFALVIAIPQVGWDAVRCATMLKTLAESA